MFTKIEIKSLKEEVVAWETGDAKTWGLLVVVIKKVVEASKQLDGTSVVGFDGKERVLGVVLWRRKEKCLVCLRSCRITFCSQLEITDWR